MEKEYDAVLFNQQFEVVLFGYHQWFNEENLVLSLGSEILDKPYKAIYRGWMMQPEKYKRFYNALAAQNIQLETTPEEYETLHIFLNVYELIKEDTAKILCFPLHKEIDVKIIKTSFKRFMVKDFVKSVKGTDFPKCFDENVTQEEFNQWMEVFYKYRGNLLTGGIVIKEFLPLKKYNGVTNEWRAFYYDGKLMNCSMNAGQMNCCPEPPKELLNRYSLPSRFYTMDYAELEDGTWKIIEVGDGQVSGLSISQSRSQMESAFYRELYYAE